MTESEISAQEARIVGMLADGWDSREIAAAEDTTIDVVKYRIHALSRRLQARNRTHLVATVLRAGLPSTVVQAKRESESPRQRIKIAGFAAVDDGEVLHRAHLAVAAAERRNDVAHYRGQQQMARAYALVLLKAGSGGSS